MSENDNLSFDSIKIFLDDLNFLSFLSKAEPYLGMNSNTLKNHLSGIIINNDFVFEMAVKKGDDFSFCVLQKSKWESEVIGKPCASLRYFFGTSIGVCNELATNLMDNCGEDFFFIQHDSRFAPSHVEISLQEAGFYTGAHYYSWRGTSKNINKSALKFADKFDIKIAKSSQADEIKSFAEHCEKSWIDNFFHFPGRFVADPYIQKYGIKLYSTWAYNSVLNLSGSDEVLVCNIEGKLAGYVVLKYLSEKKVNLGILRINPEFKGKLVGVALQSASVGVPMSKGYDTIVTRTAKFNVDNNKLLDNLGLEIINSGLQFHYINKEYLT